ncbi:hypothetical protein D043_4923B, partial [Vibrio parahaemolyticus EKP-021]
KPNTPP